MLEIMRQLAIQHLYEKLDGTGDPETWYRDTHAQRLDLLLPYLTEEARESMAGNYYVLSADPHDPTVAILESREFERERDGRLLPFVKPTGSQSGAVGPVLKRTSKKKGDSGPSPKILKTTLDGFQEHAQSDNAWASYFADCLATCRRPRLRVQGRLIEGTNDTPALVLAVAHIQETKTCFLAVADDEGRLPGECNVYLDFLLRTLASVKYTTGASGTHEGRCHLTGQLGMVYPNALKGAGLNLTNADRAGVFSNLSANNAWKRYALSLAAADALYAFYFHCRLFYISLVAGSPALVLPALHGYLAPEQRRRFMRGYSAYLEALRDRSGGVAEREGKLEYLAHQGKSVAGLTIVWANFGQNMEDVQGMVEDVLPSRLSIISHVMALTQQQESPYFPAQPISSLDLGFNHVAEVLRGPRGGRGPGADSRALFALTVTLAEAAYHARPIPRALLLSEGMQVARMYLNAIVHDTARRTWQCYSEGAAGKGLTLAGWVKHFTRLLYFFRRLEGEEMSDIETTYTPTRPELAPFFADAQRVAGLDSDAKRWCFLLGALFGRLLYMQDQRGVNTGKALGWLKGGALMARDLPGLFNKVYDKILEYRHDTDERVRQIARGRATDALLAETGALGTRLGTTIGLTQDETSYFLLLGLASSKTVTDAMRADQRPGAGELEQGEAEVAIGG